MTSEIIEGQIFNYKFTLLRDIGHPINFDEISFECYYHKDVNFSLKIKPQSLY